MDSVPTQPKSMKPQGMQILGETLLAYNNGIVERAGLSSRISLLQDQLRERKTQFERSRTKHADYPAVHDIQQQNIAKDEKQIEALTRKYKERETDLLKLSENLWKLNSRPGQNTSQVVDTASQTQTEERIRKLEKAHEDRLKEQEDRFEDRFKAQEIRFKDQEGRLKAVAEGLKAQPSREDISKQIRKEIEEQTSKAEAKLRENFSQRLREKAKEIESAFHRDLEGLRKENRSLRTENTKLRTDLQAASAEWTQAVNGLDQRVEDAVERKRQELQQRIDEIEGDQKAVRALVDDLNQESDEYKDVVLELQSKVPNTAEFAEAIGQSLEKMESLEKAGSETKEDMDKLRESLSKLGVDVTELDKTTQALSDLHEVMTDMYGGRIDSMATDLEGLATRTAAVEAALKKLPLTNGSAHGVDVVMANGTVSPVAAVDPGVSLAAATAAAEVAAVGDAAAARAPSSSSPAGPLALPSAYLGAQKAVELAENNRLAQVEQDLREVKAALNEASEGLARGAEELAHLDRSNKALDNWIWGLDQRYQNFTSKNMMSLILGQIQPSSQKINGMHARIDKLEATVYGPPGAAVAAAAAAGPLASSFGSSAAVATPTPPATTTAGVGQALAAPAAANGPELDDLGRPRKRRAVGPPEPTAVLGSDNSNAPAHTNGVDAPNNRAGAGTGTIVVDTSGVNFSRYAQNAVTTARLAGASTYTPAAQRGRPPMGAATVAGGGGANQANAPQQQQQRQHPNGNRTGAGG